MDINNLENHKYWTEKDYKWKSELCPQNELKKAREEAINLLQQNRGDCSLRSCWICNSAHYHFLSGDWGEYILRCFNCGRVFYNKIDITEYEK